VVPFFWASAIFSYEERGMMQNIAHSGDPLHTKNLLISLI